MENEMKRIGRIIAADRSLELRIEGAQAFCTEPDENGVKTVVLPALEHFEEAGISERVMHGLLDHECGHAEASDFSVFSARCTDALGPKFKRLANAIEDGYVEDRMGSLYPGCANNIAEKNETFWSTGFAGGTPARDRVADPERDAWERIITGITMRVRNHGGTTLDELIAAAPDLRATFEAIEPMLAPLNGLHRNPGQTSTCMDIAEQIWRYLEQEQTEATKPQPKSSGKGEEGDGTPSDELPMGKARPTDADAGTNPEEVINARIEVLVKNPKGRYVIYDPDFIVEAKHTDIAHSAGAYSRLVSGTSEVSESLVLAFEAALVARDATRWYTGTDEGQVDVDLLGSYALGAVGADELFREQVDEDSRNVAASILVDASGSMSYKMPLAKECATAIHQALLRVGIVHEIAAFTTVELSASHLSGAFNGLSPDWRKRAKAYMASYRDRLVAAARRGSPIHGFARAPVVRHRSHVRHWIANPMVKAPFHFIAKEFGDDDGRGIADIEATNENLDGESILYAARRLSRRHERRKVLFVLSDGQPAGSNRDEENSQYLHDALAKIEASGIELYGLGILDGSVEQFYPHHRVVHCLEDLSSVALGWLQDILVERRNEDTSWL